MTEARNGGAGEEAGLLRRLLLGVILLGTAGLGAELLLVEHFEDVWQWVPLVLLALGLFLTAAVALRPSRATLRPFQAVMALHVVSGAVGVWLHVRGNMEFEREMDATARGLHLLWTGLHGGVPALAPGAMAQLGLLGLAVAFRHPALRRPSGEGGLTSAPRADT